MADARERPAVRLWTHITAEALLHERKIVRVSSRGDAGQRAQSLDELIREGFRLLTSGRTSGGLKGQQVRRVVSALDE